jgi:hypothetical protein
MIPKTGCRFSEKIVLEQKAAPMRPWNTMRATAYGGGIGLCAAVIKSVAPWSNAPSGLGIAEELVGATLAFALLCGLAAALRNVIQRRLSGSESG